MPGDAVVERRAGPVQHAAQRRRVDRRHGLPGPRADIAVDRGVYPSAIWATYRQWTELGAQVRKNEKSSPVVFWKISDREQQEEAEDQEDGRRSRVFARGYSVFNAAQVDGYQAPGHR